MARRCVVIAEDDRDIRDNLSELFDSEGYPVILAANGREALDLLRAANPPPGLVLLDLQMPVLDGRGFLAALKNEAAPMRDTPVVVITADITARTEGSAGLLRKPFDFDELLALAARYCDAA